MMNLQISSMQEREREFKRRAEHERYVQRKRARDIRLANDVDMINQLQEKMLTFCEIKLIFLK